MPEKVNNKSSIKDLVKEVSKDTGINPEVVADVISSLTDIVVETIVNEGNFKLLNIFSITEHEIKNFKIPTKDNKIHELANKKMLRAKISKNIRDLHKMQKEQFSDKPYLVNRENWRDALVWMKNNNSNNSLVKENNKLNTADRRHTDNEFLDKDNTEF